jgi:hypothetical protein
VPGTYMGRIPRSASRKDLQLYPVYVADAQMDDFVS